MRPICLGFVAVATQTQWDRIVILGRTDSAKLVTIRVFSGTDMQLGRTDMIRVRE